MNRISQQSNGAYFLGTTVFCFCLLINLFVGDVGGYGAEDVGPELFRRDYGYLESGYWDRNDTSGLVSRSCQEARRPDCGRALSALKAFANAKSSDPKILDDILAAALRDLKNTPPGSPIYPAFVYWISRITPVAVKGPARYSHLAKIGIKYRRNDIAGDWNLDATLLKALALEHPDTFWGRQAFLEMMKNGWQVMPRCWESGVIPAVIAHGEEFLAKHPNADISPAVVYAVALAYDNWWSIAENGVVKGREPPEKAQEYVRGAERARTKAIAYYEQYVAMVGKSLVARDKIAKLKRRENNEGLYAGSPYSCEGD
jgi:hypothetical protein